VSSRQGLCWITQGMHHQGGNECLRPPVLASVLLRSFDDQNEALLVKILSGFAAVH
jgi:hypothetical protein